MNFKNGKRIGSLFHKISTSSLEFAALDITASGERCAREPLKVSHQE
jgi:hypothetical protein